MARPQVNMDLGGPEALQTSARPVNSPSATASVGGGTGIALARALSGIQPELHGYLQEMENEFREAEEARAYDEIQGMTYDESRALIESGDLRATESPWFKAAFDKQFGLAHAARRRREIIDTYNNGFDKHGGDVEQFLADYAASDAEQFQDNKHIMAGLREGMSGVFGRIKDDHSEWQSGVTREQASDNFLDVARGAFDQAIEAGTNPMEAVRALYAGHNEMLGLTFPEMDDYVMQLAEERANAGDLEGVRALMETDVIAADGTPVGSFTQRQRFSLKAQGLIDRAEATAGTNLRRGTTETMVGLIERAGAGALDSTDRAQLATLHDQRAITTERYESMLTQNNAAQLRATASAWTDNMQGQALTHAHGMIEAGQGYALQDVRVVNPYTGEEETFSASSLMEEAAADIVNTVMATEGATPAMAAQRMAEWGINYTYPPFENAMSHGFLSLTEAVAAAGEGGSINIPEPALAGYSTWKAMSNQPRLRDAHITGSAAGDVYRDAATLERLGLATAEEALMRSASIDRSAGRRGVSSRLDPRAFENKVAGAIATGWTRMSAAVNASDVSSSVEQAARILIDLGVGPKQAVDQAVEAHKESYETINGVAINVRDRFIPPNFSEITGFVLNEFADLTGERARDLTIVPSHEGSDYWIVAYRDTLLPVSADNHHGRYHISQLQDATLHPTSALDDVNATIRGRTPPPTTSTPSNAFNPENFGP